MRRRKRRWRVCAGLWCGACGHAVDMRATFPTGAYEEEGATIVVQRAGDAFSRLVVRLLESLESMRLVEQAWTTCRPGP